MVVDRKKIVNFSEIYKYAWHKTRKLWEGKRIAKKPQDNFQKPIESNMIYD